MTVCPVPAAVIGSRMDLRSPLTGSDQAATEDRGGQALRGHSRVTVIALAPCLLSQPPIRSAPSTSTGPAAVRLWQLMTAWLEFPQLYEVQRPKSRQDLTAIAQTFRPYLEARDWITIQKETP